MITEPYSHAAIAGIVTRWACNEPLIRRVYLFGSRARGNHRPDSDVDLAVFNAIDPQQLEDWIGSALPGADTALLAACARDYTYGENWRRWHTALTDLFNVTVQVERSQRRDHIVRPSLKRCRVLLYRQTM